MKNFKNYVWCCSFMLCSILLTEVYTQEAMPGPCKTVKKIKHFNFKKFLGDWYEVARTTREFQNNKTCMKLHYSDGSDDDHMISSRLYVSTDDGEKYNSTRSVMINKKTGEGVTPEGYPFAILDIDYDEFMIIYACTNIGDTHKEITWINTRDRTPRSETVTSAVRTARSFGIDPNSLILTNQVYCPKSFEGATNE